MVFNKKYFLSVLLLSLLVSSLFFAIISIKNIKSGILISEPVTINVCANFINKNELQVYRITRANAFFSLSSQDVGSCKVYESKEWFRGVKLLIDKNTLLSLKSVKLKIGDKDWYFKSDQFENRSITSSQQYAYLFIDSSMVKSSVSSLSALSGLINWPGDFILIWRCLKTGGEAFGLCFVLLFLAVYFLCWWNEKNKEKLILMDESEVKKTAQFYKYLLAFILSIISLSIFIKNSPSAYDWPAMDMGPFFARNVDVNFAVDDFFTNSSSKPNPRFIFGYFVIGLKNILFTDWYSAMFFLKLVMVIFMAPLIFLALSSIFININDEKRKIVLYFLIFIFIITAFSGSIINFFTIALWSLFNVTSTPQCLSVFIAFFAILINSFKNLKKLVPFFWLVASLLHPAVGMFLLILFFIINFLNNTKINYITFFLSGIVAPFFILLFLFPTEHSLSAAGFVYHYILANHSFHYLPSYFTTTSTNPLPWYFSFALINLLFIVSLYVGYFKKDKFLKVVSFLSLITYAGSVFLQYIFVELYPIKIVAMIGPVRYTMVGYWLLAIIYSYIFSDFYKYFSFLFVKVKCNFKKFCYFVPPLVLLMILVFVYFIYKDNPFQKIRDDNKKLYSWVNSNTKANEIFVSNVHELIVNLPLVANRSIFTGNGFPFREDDFVEYDKRRFLVFGSPEDWKKTDDGSWDGIKINNFYRSLKPEDFVKISAQYPLDYVIIENNFSAQFYKFIPLYEDNDIKIYKITDFKNKKI